MNIAKSSSYWLGLKLKPWQDQTQKQQIRRGTLVITMRDRSKNRKPLQKGRNLSIEAIQAVQALKRARANANNSNSLEQIFDSKFRRLLKFDMVAVLRELLRQNQCLLALKVFDDIRKESWYRPRVALYAEMIQKGLAFIIYEYDVWAVTGRTTTCARQCVRDALITIFLVEATLSNILLYTT